MGRDDIPLAACKRITQSGASKETPRMGEDASEVAQKQLELLVRKLGEMCHRQCQAQKRETVNLAVLRMVVEQHASCKGIQDSDFSLAVRRGKGQRGLPRAGLVRAFKAAGPKRISEEAADALVGVSEAFLKNLGHKASVLAKASKRQTLQAADVKAAASL